jgi:hypothetical protein
MIKMTIDCKGCAKPKLAIVLGTFKTCEYCKERYERNEKPKPPISFNIQYKMCEMCHQSLPKSHFDLHQSTFDNLHPYCHGCRQNIYYPLVLFKQCSICQKLLVADNTNFYDYPFTSDKLSTFCKHCVALSEYTKECTKCLITKPLSEFYIDNYSSDQHGSQCKQCVYQPKEKPALKQGFKGCNKCYQIKPFNQFYRDNANKDGLSHKCKDCKYPNRK